MAMVPSQGQGMSKGTRTCCLCGTHGDRQGVQSKFQKDGDKNPAKIWTQSLLLTLRDPPLQNFYQ